MPRIVSVASRIATLRTNAKAKANKTTPTDTVAAVSKMLGANFEKVEVGKGMVFKVPEGVAGKSYLAQARGKLMSVTREGQPWAGRVYLTVLDSEANEVIVERQADTNNPPKRLVGRKAGTKNGIKADIEKAKSHLGGTEGTKPTTTKEEADKPTDKPKASNKTKGAQDTEVKDLTK